MRGSGETIRDGLTEEGDEQVRENKRYELSRARNMRMRGNKDGV
jgi:hypothetical protein